MPLDVFSEEIQFYELEEYAIAKLKSEFHIFLKPSWNKKGWKVLRYLTKKQSFYKEKDCSFVGYLKIFKPFLFCDGFSILLAV